MTAAPDTRTTTKRAASAQAASGRRGRSAAAPPCACHSGQKAAAQVLDKHSMTVSLPAGLGTVRLPTPNRLGFYGGIAALAALGILDWPVAVVIGVGHLLAEDHHHRVLAEFGEALGEA